MRISGHIFESKLVLLALLNREEYNKKSLKIS